MTVFIIILFILVGLILLYKFASSPESIDRIKITGIENISFENVNNSNTFYLVYPASRSQKETLIKEVLTTGEVIREFEVTDEVFRRFHVNQKPNELHQLYMSLKGQAIIDNCFYIYDIDKKKFTQVKIDEYLYGKVGIRQIKHYGNDILFEAISNTETTHFDEERDYYGSSISNFSKKVSWEVTKGYKATDEAILQFGHKIIYGNYHENNEYQSSIAIINSLTGTTEHVSLDDEIGEWEYFPLYATEEHAYILGEQGMLYVLNQQLNVKKYTPFDSMPQQECYHDMNASLFIDHLTALHIVYKEENVSIPTLGIFSFHDIPTFTIIDTDYLRENYYYKILYQDVKKQEIYLLGTDENNDHLLVIHHKTFDLLYDIPIEDGESLDLVIKT
ncbi:hypothetical protein DFR56_102369 [Pseudogracilibacillus auburnensis]|uniref:Uncharacterized protein n=1 Tax=Pseudogracilibacillus auburnensis TaxID=1494959 RepID=A0A2V3W9B1_9BACI|nr:hypothetical protein DFR56_102369 [Pseudogracilibacillus auburnensis]